MRVVFVTQQLDPAHPVLATTVPQVAALARRVDELVVVADRIDPASLPANARGYSFRSRSKPGRGLRLASLLAGELGRLRAGGGVVAHMCPVYAVVAAPVVRPAGVPLLLWYTHWKGHAVVRAAEALCTTVVSASPRSFPLSSRKVVPLGQAIDVDRFPPRPPRADDGTLRALVVGRYSTAKGVATIVRATRLARDAGLDVRLDVHGPVTDTASGAHRRELEALVEWLGLRDAVRLHDAVAPGDLPALFASSDVLVNNARGGADRIVYEAAAGGLPVLAWNPSHEDLLDPDGFFGRDDAAGLASRLAALAALSSAGRGAIGRLLRERAAAGHSVDSWASGLVRAIGRDPRAGAARSADGTDAPRSGAPYHLH